MGDLFKGLFNLIIDILGAAFGFWILLILGAALTIGGIVGAVVLFKKLYIYAIIGERVNKSTVQHSNVRVKPENSKLFLAFLQKIADGELNKLYINSHIACVNFNNPEIAESSVIDFTKLGYDIIPLGDIPGYYKALKKAASSLPNVASVKISSFYFTPKSYLVSDDSYKNYKNDCCMISIDYRVISNKKLKSFDN